ncbi:hypothetical protein, partial [Sinomonas sp. G460-2]|uniref:hypothetical protein n=1 Tax=Sinomonas sp. G460-2 TaxID=3393464 RepID=UPI0039EED350
MSTSTVVGALLVVAGSSVAFPVASPPEGAVAAQASAAVVLDPLAEHAELAQMAREATREQAVLA